LNVWREEGAPYHMIVYLQMSGHEVNAFMSSTFDDEVLVSSLVPSPMSLSS